MVDILAANWYFKHPTKSYSHLFNHPAIMKTLNFLVVLASVACSPSTVSDFATRDALSLDPLPRRILYESITDNGSEVFLINEDGTDRVNVTNRAGYDGMPSWSYAGDEILFVSDRDSDVRARDVYIMRADGTDVRRITTDGAGYSFPKLSPDGTYIGFDASRGLANAQVWIMNSDGDNVTRLTYNDVDEGYVSWSSDSTKLVFDSFRDGSPEIYQVNINDLAVTRLTHFTAHIGDPRMSPSGTQLAFESGMSGNSEIYVTAADGSNLAQLTDNPADDRAPAISPDGLRVVFCSDRGAPPEAFELFVMDIDGTGLTKITNTGTSNLYPTFAPQGLPER